VQTWNNDPSRRFSLPTLDIPPAQERVEQVWLNRFGHLVHSHLCTFSDVANHYQPIGTLYTMSTQ
jgi:hypothetical protein